MCLNIVEEVPESMCEGQAIKYLRKNEDSSYRPEWPYFKDRGGGISDSKKYPHSQLIKNEVVYRLGETYVVDHTRKCLGFGGDIPYPAGVHLYLEKDDYNPNLVPVLCEYKRAVVWDCDNVIVAMEVTPIREL